MTLSEIEAGLRAGKTLRVDRRDCPLLPDLLDLVNRGDVTSEFVEVDEQYSFLEFRLAMDSILAKHELRIKEPEQQLADELGKIRRQIARQIVATLRQVAGQRTELDGMPLLDGRYQGVMACIDAIKAKFGVTDE